MKRLFVLKPVQSVSDVITNSSSELFIFKDVKNGQKEVTDLLDQLSATLHGYGSWTNEYETPRLYENLDDEEKETARRELFDDFCEAYCKDPWNQRYDGTTGFGYQNPHPYLNSFSFYANSVEDQAKIKNFLAKYKDVSAEALVAKDFGLTPEEFYSNWNTYKPWVVWKREEDNLPGLETITDWDDYYELKELNLSEKGEAALCEKLKDFYFLFSYDENPNWDFQEILMNVSSRHHLG